MSYNGLDRNSMNCIKQASKRSDLTENLFEEKMALCGFKVEKATKYENSMLHIDRWITDVEGKIWKKGTRLSVDVKDERNTHIAKKKNGKKTGKVIIPPIGVDEPCHSYEYWKMGYKGWSVCDHNPTFFAFETTKDGTVTKQTKWGEKYDIGTSFILIESQYLKADALRLKEKHGYRRPDAVTKGYFRKYFQLLLQRNDNGGNYYIHIPRSYVLNLDHLYLKC